MIPILYDKTGNVKLGELTNCIECLVEEIAFYLKRKNIATGGV